jgi:hypothetical protein
MKKWPLLIVLLLVPACAHGQVLIATPGWHSIPSTALCGGGAESNAPFVDPNNFPANLNASYTSYGFSFQGSATCNQYLMDSNGGVMDTTRHRLIIWGGGHQHYWGNDATSLELTNIGTANPAMIHLNHSGNPNSCPTSGPANTTVSGPNGSICSYLGTGAINNVIAFDKCNWNGTFGAVCSPTGANPGSVHTYDGIAYIPGFDEMGVFGGSFAPNGNASQTAWLLQMSSVLASCAPNLTTNIIGCNPSWTALGNPASNNTFASPGSGNIAVYDPNAQGVWVATLQNLFFFNPSTNTFTQKGNSSIGHHSSGALDPVDKLFILIGPQSTTPPEGVLYFDVSTGSTFTLHIPTTVNCGTITTVYNGLNLPAGQYQGVVWDPISRQVVIYPNGGNTIWLLDPKTWTCTSETYGSTQGTDFPPDTPLVGSAANGTFSHFNYDPGLDVFALCNDPNKDCWYFHRRR